MAAATLIINPVPNPIGDILASCDFPKEISGIVNDYVMRRPECFGGVEWLKYFDVDVGNPLLPIEFVSWWRGSDAVDLFERRPVIRSNYETHLDPIWRPQSIGGQDYDLETLARLVANPLNGGHPTTIHQTSEAFQQHARRPTEPGCWLVFRRDVVARNQCYNEQIGYMDDLNSATGARYERESRLLDLATGVAVRHVYKGERYLGDATGMEGRVTCARSGDLVPYKDMNLPSDIGNFERSGVSVCRSDFERESHGVAPLRKFGSSESKGP